MDADVAASAPVAAPTDATPATPGVVIAGRVVAAAFHAEGWAHVTATASDGRSHTTDCDLSGRFRLDVGPRARPGELSGTLHCFSEKDGAGAARFSVPVGAKEPFDVGTVQLGAEGSLGVHVTHAGADVEGAAVRLSVIPQGWSGYRASMPLVDANTDAGGRARFDHVPCGPVCVVASSLQSGRGICDAVVPAGADCEVDLTRRDVDVFVKASDTGKGVAGARLDARWLRRSGTVSVSSDSDPQPGLAPTDAEGQTRIVVGEKDELVLGVRAEGYATQTEIRVRAGQRELTIQMVRKIGFAWPIVVGELLPPPEGTEIRLRPKIGSGRNDVVATGTMMGSDLVVHGIEPGLFSAVAVAPDGSLASLWADTTEGRGRPTSFVRPRSIDVRITEEGMPAEGVYILALNLGNNAFGPPVPTDSAGHVVLTDFEGGPVAVHLVSGPDVRYPEHLLATVNLDAGDARATADVPRARTIVASVTVDGVPGLPPVFYIGPASGMLAGMERDSDSGTATLRVRPEKPLAPITLNTIAPGYLPVRVEVPGAAWNEPAHVDIELHRGASLVGRVVPPADGRTSLNVEREIETSGSWGPVPARGNVLMPLTPDSAGNVTIDGVASGRYRLRDERSGATTAAIEVAAGGEAKFPTLDLSGSGDAKGRIEGPDGKAPWGCRVLVEGDGIDQSSMFPRPGNTGETVAKDGTFSVRVPGDRTVRLRAWHPTLVPAPEGGVVEVVKARDGIVLHLVPGPTATMELSAAPDWASWQPTVNVQLLQGEPGSKPVAVPSVSLSERTITLGAYTPGTYTMWIDVAGYAPRVLRDVELRAGQTALPRVELSRGSSIRVQLLPKAGESPPSVYLFASSTAAPWYSRGLQASGKAELLIQGLGAGKFRLTGGVNPGQPNSFRREVEVDGTNSVDVEWELR
jgi:hypothetical protein